MLGSGCEGACTPKEEEMSIPVNLTNGTTILGNSDYTINGGSTTDAILTVGNGTDVLAGTGYNTNFLISFGNGNDTFIAAATEQPRRLT
jgi:hypothetical protein